MVTVEPVNLAGKVPVSTTGLSNEQIALGIKIPVQQRIKAINLIAESKNPDAYKTLISCVFDGLFSDIRTAALRGLKTLRESGIEPPAKIDVLKILRIARNDHSPAGREADNVYGYWLKKNREVGIASILETPKKLASPSEDAEVQRKASESKKPDQGIVQDYTPDYKKT